MRQITLNLCENEYLGADKGKSEGEQNQILHNSCTTFRTAKILQPKSLTNEVLIALTWAKQGKVIEKVLSAALSISSEL